MGISNGIITKPVNLGDVQNSLGESSNDIGFLCSNQHGKINPASRYKPTASARINPDPRPVLGADGVWRDSDGGESRWWYGDVPALEVPSLDAFFRAAIASASHSRNVSLLAWNYRPPQGGISEPYQLADFLGYYHAAQWPMRAKVSQSFGVKPGIIKINLTDRWGNTGEGDGFDAERIASRGSYGCEYSIADLLSVARQSIHVSGTPGENLYLGIAIWNVDTDTFYYGTNGDPIDFTAPDTFSMKLRTNGDHITNGGIGFMHYPAAGQRLIICAYIVTSGANPPAAGRFFNFSTNIPATLTGLFSPAPSSETASEASADINVQADAYYEVRQTVTYEYSLSGLSVSPVFQLGLSTCYLRGNDGYIYRCTLGISNIDGTASLKRTGNVSDAGMGLTVRRGIKVLTGGLNEVFSHYAETHVIGGSSGAPGLNNAMQLSFNIPEWKVYPSYADACNETNETMLGYEVIIPTAVTYEDDPTMDENSIFHSLTDVTVRIDVEVRIDADDAEREDEDAGIRFITTTVTKPAEGTDPIIYQS